MCETIVPDFLRPGEKTPIGEHTFHADEVIRFANKFDPQRFHTDPEAAKTSMFGGLCASGWHTASVWMKLQRKSVAENVTRLKSEGLPYPEFGPSPGMKNLKWLRPVFANDTISYANETKTLRKSNSKTGWWILENFSDGTNQNGKTVIQFESTVFLQIHSGK